MTTFYLMPPRADMARRFAAFLKVWFPGVHPRLEQLPDILEATIDPGADAVVLFGEDLPLARGEMLDDCLSDGFGAEPGDRVVDMRVGPIDGVAADTHIIGTGRSLLRFARFTRMAG
ncbi:MAG: hypothetical protein ACJ8C4_12660 [Gemmataceae bacterium]